jgi:hypothetical protein
MNFFFKIVFLSIFAFFYTLNATTTRTQVINLKQGWNAVYLEVEPNIELQDLSKFIVDSTGLSFNNNPIQIITTFNPEISSIEYISDPDEKEYKKASWNSWLNDNKIESFLTDLHGLISHKGYLIKSSADFSWTIEGEVLLKSKKWEANSFNLVGFDVQETGTSFYQLFNTENALKNTVVYKLANNKWIKITSSDFVNEVVEKGKAYWVYSDGATDFNGVLDITVEQGKDKIDFSSFLKTQTVYFKNNSAEDPLTVNLELINNNVPLLVTEYDANMTKVFTPVSGEFKTFEIEADSTVNIQFGVRHVDIPTGDEVQGLLKITTNETGEEKWISIQAKGK